MVALSLFRTLRLSAERDPVRLEDRTLKQQIEAAL
jgi:hypothetical protein